MENTCTDCNNLVSRCTCGFSVSGSAWSQRHRWEATNATWMREMAGAQQEVYRHKKTGGIYAVVCNATGESDGVLLVVYRNIETGDRWARPASSVDA